jgi:hypothetical protein
VVFKVTQEGFRIAAEAGAQSSAVAPAFKAAAKPTPGLQVARRQITGLDRPQAGDGRRKPANWTAKHQAR